MGELLKPTVSLFIICTVVTSVLAFTYEGTKDTIDIRTAQAAAQARLEVLESADGFEAVEGIDGITSANQEHAMVKEAFRGTKNGETVGYVLSVDSQGYGGGIELTVGIDLSGAITGVRIGDNQETPGLGTKAKEPPFLSQFDGLAPEEPLQLVKGNKSRDEEIDAVSGATITSRAVVQGVQAACDIAAELLKREEGLNGRS